MAVDAYQELGISKEELENHLHQIRLFNEKNPLKLSVKTIEKVFSGVLSDVSEPKEYRILVEEGNLSDGSLDLKEFFLKQYINRSKLEKESEILQVADRHADWDTYSLTRSKGEKIRIFPKPLSCSYTEFNNRNLLLQEAFPTMTLEKKLSDKDDHSVHYLETEAALEPLILLHDLLPQYENEIKKEYLTKFSKDRCMKIVKAGLNILGPGFGEDNRLLDSFSDLIEYLSKEKFTIIQQDGYPWHNMLSGLVNTNIMKGPRALHLGYLFGNPRVYKKLENIGNAVNEICATYNWKRNKLVEQKKFERFDRDLDVRLLKMAFYIGAIIGNFDTALRLTRIKDEAEKNKKEKLRELGNLFTSIRDQLSNLSIIEEEQGRNVALTIYDALAPKIENKNKELTESIIASP